MNDVTTLVDLARRVARGLGRIERDQVCCGDTTLQQFETLQALHAAPAMTTSALAAQLGIELSTASRNLAVLERNGYLRRERNRENGREVTNKLTAKGTRCVTSLCCDERLVFASVLARISATERPHVIDALGVLARALENSDAAACAPGCCPPSAAKGTSR